jgi:hypothetical protein
VYNLIIPKYLKISTVFELKHGFIHREAREMDKWEYTSIKLETKGILGGILEEESFDTELNRLGEQGWELVSCFPTAQGYGQSREVISVFKRRKQEYEI